MFENIRQDYLRRRKKATPWRIMFAAAADAGFRAVVLYRMGRYCRIHHLGIAAIFLERLMHHWCHCWTSTLAEIGPGFVIAHVCGIIIPPNTVIGKNCDVRQNVTLGGNYGKVGEDGRTNPWIGDNVSIGAGAAVLGPIRIGSNTIIGANCVVTNSVPENSVAGAFRAEVIGQRAENGTITRPEKHKFFSRKKIYKRLSELEDRIKKLEESRLGDQKRIK